LKHAAKKYVFLLVTLTTEALCPSEASVLQEPHDLIPQTTAFFLVAAVKTSNRTWFDSRQKKLLLPKFWIIVRNERETLYKKLAPV
jgi:hypothetical protein